MNPPALNLNYVRDQFPALKENFIFMDNAGGSQTLGLVMDRITHYLTHYDVQLGATYKISAHAGQQLHEAHVTLAEMINAERSEEVIIGPSTTMLLRILSICLSKQWSPGDEIIVTNTDHEANVCCWTDLEAAGLKIKIWKADPVTYRLNPAELQKLLSPRTRLVAMVHASNILGTINPIREISEMVHDAGALFCVDGVAYAPHRHIDVQKFGADFYVFSTYKVYGPHQAVMYGRYELLRHMDGINHYFITGDDIPYKFQPGNVNFELSYSLAGIADYFLRLADYHYPGIKMPVSEKYLKSSALIAQYEENLSARLLNYLTSRKELTIIGETDSSSTIRVPTISFIHNKRKSSEIVEKIDPYGIGIRFGDFYAKKLIHDLGLIEKDGVIRVSMVHYNTLEEVDRLISAFSEVIV